MNDAHPLETIAPPVTAAEVLEPPPAEWAPWWCRVLRATANGAATVDAVLENAANRVSGRFRVPPGGG